MSDSLKKWIVCVSIPLVTGFVSAWLTKNSRTLYETIQKPAASPPGGVFPVVWTILFLLMGTASYLVISSSADEVSVQLAMTLYVIQLLFNFVWPLLFFLQNRYGVAFIWLIFLEVLIAATTLLFFRISKAAGILMLPYLIWVAFAGYLNYSVYLLNGMEM